MRFKTDENLPVEIAALHRQQGHDAVAVGDEGWRVLPTRRHPQLVRLHQGRLYGRGGDGLAFRKELCIVKYAERPVWRFEMIRNGDGSRRRLGLNLEMLFDAS